MPNLTHSKTLKCDVPVEVSTSSNQRISSFRCWTETYSFPAHSSTLPLPGVPEWDRSCLIQTQREQNLDLNGNSQFESNNRISNKMVKKVWKRKSESARKSLNTAQALFSDSNNSDVLSTLFWSQIWNTASYGLLWTKLKCTSYSKIRSNGRIRTERLKNRKKLFSIKPDWNWGHVLLFTTTVVWDSSSTSPKCLIVHQSMSILHTRTSAWGLHQKLLSFIGF